MEKEKEIIQHPAFALVRFSRISGNGAKFYGSEIPVDHWIQLEIQESEIERSLTDDRFRGTRNLPILRIRLSPNQFSELITSMNMGEGVPCTLEYREGKHVQDIPDIENRKEFVHRAFEERMKEFSMSLANKNERAKALIAKKSLSKADQGELSWILGAAIQEIRSNIPFFSKCFQETVDRTVLDAKSEIDAAILHKITTLGLNALHKQNKLLTDGEV